MGFSLSPLAKLSGYRLEAFETIGSTNTVALERASASDRGKLWIVSKAQENGRGRRGRAWKTPHGNLAATLLLVLSSYELQRVATLGFVAGLSLIDALEAVDAGSKSLKSTNIALKWPNDILANGAKLAGILLESIHLSQKCFVIAIGIGVNVISFPENLPYPATSLKDLGIGCDAETLFFSLSESWQKNSAIWDEGRGLAAIRVRWLTRANGLGDEVHIHWDGNIVHGIFETIDEECRFIIRKKDGQQIKITAGEVYFGKISSAGSA